MDHSCDDFLRWALPRLRLRWSGFRRVRRQVCRRIRSRQHALHLTDLEAYRDYLRRHDEEWSYLLGLCRVTISRFYRDRTWLEWLHDEGWELLARLAAARGERRIRSWSAGCASGEEPFSIKLSHEFSGSPSELEVIATDIDSMVLRRADLGVFEESSLRELPEAWRRDAFELAGDGFRLRTRFRAGVRFVEADVREVFPAGVFHLVLWRNLVFTYFSEDLQRELLDCLEGRLAKGGFLVVGAHERLPTNETRFDRVHGQRLVYRLRGKALASSLANAECSSAERM